MLDKIVSLISQALGIEPTDVSETSLLREDLGLTEADLSEIVASLNREYECAIPEDQTGDVITVADLVELAENHVETKG
ncbi:MAG: hypothetical protein A3D24_00240 [Candidatus Blackburnbacteria bacterium RIFCSPHIGHO2_02_FULL_39_13]|uniref:Carrier domain-containing protein n=1 Tax=Candidatus Blackburnbacteria bacterium RIFCSPLOWO2_01_FULL_40_20 TaxID=1797519 RepID=A0A1G1VFH7_9BACT|nr:MAG: Acyl carrier protein [Microgenomates group bacterium GW2011_GWA2_39_19]OGY07225.1 MAG: hypothetical protein A2694_02330 [Candidatus Blackburnbacteria bacterium RIFCSPHIGHO2_01_FULL_40_17]OGY09448.1 MAG: hypothetical protein A3D24_00240 [Candidatus Blackburnbacteria bacterium RIFCSPHIGHO2_02_FULL_39_13]OGY14026.1 MAG: hypothetical protein A3A77_03455 [Candidatus Blackburnbacteria bacterium RIFCSPLOWO2_01_FULL_40_20]OGY15718.1 MAG: hypothetical protein A3I52_01490 [Candidatus Blackburnbac